MDEKYNVRTEHYRFCFREDTDTDWAVDCLINGEDPPMTIKCTVFAEKDGKKVPVAWYVRDYEKRVNNGVVYSFINRFMADPEYRKQFYVRGEKITEVFVNQGLVNERCRKAIKKLNRISPHFLKFKHFAELKTFGRDKVSGMKLPEIENFIGTDVISQIQQELDDEKMVLSASRWVVRGLSVENAIRKAKVDREIADNCR